MWLKIVAAILAVVVLGVAAALVYGARRWRAATMAFIARLDGSRLPPARATYDEGELEGLPRPVVRYFRAVLREGQPLIAGARIVWEGRFRIGESDDSWRPFVAAQLYSANPPGFVWDASIRMVPGVGVRVRDAYVAGAGAMRGEVLGLVPVVDLHDTPEIASGALQRYLGEAVWLPTRLLPSQGVHWAPMDDSRARATLSDGHTTVSLEFRFRAGGEVAGVYTPSRYREVRGAFQPTPWAGRFAAYVERGGMRIPSGGEVEWQLADRQLPYWRGRVTEVAYTYAQ